MDSLPAVVVPASVLKVGAGVIGAMGAAEFVPHRHDGSTLRVVRELRAQGVSVWACETTSDAVGATRDMEPHHRQGRTPPDGLLTVWQVDLRSAALPQPLALVLGNEVRSA